MQATALRTAGLAGPGGDCERARLLLREYAASLDVDLCFQGFEQELERLSVDYGPPHGAFLVAEQGGEAIGCVALRLHVDGVAELKRLYVRPAARGQGLGRQLAEGMIAEARRLGYQRVVLDTLPSMHEARALYDALGFRLANAYRPNPVPGTVYLELVL
jgi:ribosomal protein S18 acetylase RimI-like enzyme